MSSANLDLVRSIYAAWERGDFRSTEWAHPEIEIVFEDAPSPGSWTGLAAVDAARGFLSPWEDYRAEAEELRELDSERVLGFVRAGGGHGKTSGLDLEQVVNRGANLFHVRDGKVTRLVTWWHRERALADLGLASEDGSP